MNGNIIMKYGNNKIKEVLLNGGLNLKGLQMKNNKKFKYLSKLFNYFLLNFRKIITLR